METLVKSCNVCWIFSGMPRVLQNNELPIFLGRVELFCLFACSYTSIEATVLLCHFNWVRSGMPKVLWNNKSPISYVMFVGFGQACPRFSKITNYQISLGRFETLSYRSPQLWSLLPEHMRQINSLDQFKRCVRQWICNTCPCRLCIVYCRIFVNLL